MTRFVMPSREEIHKAYLEGEETIVALFERTIGQLAVRVVTVPKLGKPLEVGSQLKVSPYHRPQVGGKRLSSLNSQL